MARPEAEPATQAGGDGGGGDSGVGDPRPATVADAMLTHPTTHPPGVTVGRLRAELATRKIHLVLLVDHGVLLGTLDRADVEGLDDTAVASAHATLADRTTTADADLDQVRDAMVATGRRRLAVVDAQGRLLGLLCRKARGVGFCTDDGVAARAAERAGGA